MKHRDLVNFYHAMSYCGLMAYCQQRKDCREVGHDVIAHMIN